MSGEGQLVDFKRTSDGISAEDLVAFANAPEGGTILAGVGEQSVEGAQVGVILGCDVSDGAVLQILNKAISCLPPVSVDIVVENLGDKPILRIGVPSSSTRPHCTPKGLYCRRDGSRNRALHPGELLEIFLDVEARVFAERFETAASSISEELESLEDSLSATIRNMSNELGWAQSNLDDTSSTIDTILAYAKRVDDETIDISDRLRALFRQDERDDPVRDRTRKELTQELVDQISEDADLMKAILANRELSYTMRGKTARELTVEDGQKALAEAAKIIHDREDRKNYQARIADPGDCSPQTLDAITAAVARGEDKARVRAALAGAFRIAFSIYKGKVVAVAGLAKPRAAARAALFKRMACSADPAEFRIRLDWLYLHQDHRNKGQLTKLVTELRKLTKGQPLFSLAKRGDALTRELLAHLKFKPATRQADSAEGEEVPEALFLLAAARA
ncbi:ATP-binding protein [Sphingopyxis sp. Geo24]|uniref:AlbA family DNA-binding domain-containing protein n=1 Tax=Sphingopyxis sp. Geo24 TaxID=340058 RepID=UPI0024ADBD8F|nr:ATP-binding protein [Sphingopyxis sp. Geo24]